MRDWSVLHDQSHRPGLFCFGPQAPRVRVEHPSATSLTEMPPARPARIQARPPPLPLARSQAAELVVACLSLCKVLGRGSKKSVK